MLRFGEDILAKSNKCVTFVPLLNTLRKPETTHNYTPLKKDHYIEYAYDLSGFFKTYNFFDVTAFAKRVGVNASLMRRYKTGIKKTSSTQKTKILEEIHAVADELHMVQF